MKKIYVIIILSFLIASIAIIKLDPEEKWKEYQDKQRLNHLTLLKQSLDNYIKYNSGGRINLGSVGVVYSSENYLSEIDGSGWLPVDFKGSGVNMKKLPLDPINNNDFVYTYTTSSKLEYKLTAKFESQSYQEKYANDGGINPDRYEIGTNPGLKP